MSEVQTAERLVRRFARETNLLLAGRPVRVRRQHPVSLPGANPTDAPSGATPRAVARPAPAPSRAAQAADALERMLRALGAVVLDPSALPQPGLVEFALDLLPPGADAVDAPLLLDGAPLPARGDAAGRIAFAGAQMPVARAIAESLDLGGLRVGVAMMLEPKTAQLALLLRAAGAHVAIYAHPDETDPAIADALRVMGFTVIADPNLTGPAERAAAVGFLRRGFDVLIDDGAHLIRLAHEEDPDLPAGWIGANEETTSGLTPLRAMHRAGMLRTAVMAVNDARTKTRFDNRYGTGQSCVFAIADLLDGQGITVRDQTALVIGYGPVGKGVAAHLAAFGAEVRVAERDPVRALEALHDGYPVAPAHELAAGALVVSATGVAGTVTAELLALARIVAVAGGVPGEIESPADPGETLLLGGGGAVNIVAAEGNPIEIMDLSFAVQLAALDELVRTRPGVGVHTLPPEIDERIARAALAARGRAIDAPPAQAASPAAPWRSPRYRERP